MKICIMLYGHMEKQILTLSIMGIWGESILILQDIELKIQTQ